jgi:hypothetical protein
MQSQLRMRIALAVCGLALLSIPLGSFLASAHTQTYGANLSIHFDKKTQTFNGHVGTSSFCHEDRLVSLYRTDSGSDVLVGTSVSDHSGQWGDLSWTGPGSYVARVTLVHESGYGHDHTCLAGSSPVATVP